MNRHSRAVSAAMTVAIDGLGPTIALTLGI